MIIARKAIQDGWNDPALLAAILVEEHDVTHIGPSGQGISVANDDRVPV